MPNIPCKICKKKFYAKPSKSKIGWGKYCSKKCQSVAQRKGKDVPCATCKKIVYRAPKDLKSSKSNLFYCDKSCFAKAKNILWAYGEEHFNWKTGKAVYRELMIRNSIKATCTDCGIDDVRVLVVHHIDRNRKNNTLENLKWLCRNCHFLEHRKDGHTLK